VNPVTLWGLLVLATTFAGLPALVGTGRILSDVQAGANLWPMFWALGIGLVTAVIGGLAGGAMPRNRATYESAASASSYAQERSAAA
jgi:hypothetical protein